MLYQRMLDCQLLHDYEHFNVSRYRAILYVVSFYEPPSCLLQPRTNTRTCRGPQALSPQSPDLMPLDYFLWGCLKGMIYQQKSQAAEELLQQIM